MTKRFSGLYTAIITPFTTDNQIDYKKLAPLIEEQIAANVNGLIVLGTTGESPTISTEERKTLIAFFVKTVNKRVDIIVGTGSNNTQETICKSQQAETLGADGLLVVNPYYNKPTQEGLFQHFSAIANAVHSPIMLYNIKGRTAVNLETETLLKLSAHQNIVAVKEASGDILQMMDVISKVPDNFSVLSGDDALTYSLINLGGDGVVSVLANIMPEKMKALVQHALNNNTKEAMKCHYALLPTMKSTLSVGSNPQAIKTILAWQHKIEEVFRLPMCALNNEQKTALNDMINGC